MSTPTIDYAALAQQAKGGKPESVDYAALAAQARGGSPGVPKINPPSAPPGLASQPPGFLERANEPLGIPTSIDDLKQLGQKALSVIPGHVTVPQPNESIVHYGVRSIPLVGDALLNYGENVKNAAVSAYQEGKEADQNVAKGGSKIQNFGKKMAAGTEFGGALLSPLGGQVPVNLGTDLQQKNYKGAAGDVAGGLIAAALLKAGRKPEMLPEDLRVSKIGRAIGATGPAEDFGESIKTALPELEKAAQTTGVPTSVKDMKNVLRTADQNLNTEYNLRLQPIRGQKVVPIPISDDIKLAADKFDPASPVEKPIRDRLLKRASEFEQEKSLGQLDQQRMNANARNRSFERASASGQTAQLRTQADAIADKIIADGARDIVYDAMDKFHNANLPPGVQPFDFRALKGKQAALFDLMDQTNKEANSLANQSLVKKGSTLVEKGHISTFGHPSGRIGFSVHNLLGLFSDPEAGAGRAVSKAFTPQVGPGSMVANVAATGPVRSESMYPTPQSVMLGMKSGALPMDEGNRLLQKMRGKGSVLRPMEPPK